MIYTILLILLGIAVSIFFIVKDYMEDRLVTIIFIIIGLLIYIPLSLLPVYCIGFYYETGRGEHTGFVTAVEKQGIFYKTGRAYVKTDTQSSQEDKYCVIDEKVYNQLQELSKDKKQVTVKYMSYLSAGIKYCGGEEAIIYEVK